jgi:hypothetical protein
VSAAADTRPPATRYRPDDPLLLAREASRLASQGLTARDIEGSLQLRAGEARVLLGIAALDAAAAERGA